ncbi:MAG TPA: tetratricopeptide repeat protein [Opitutaceae bacterium]|nr:tetratricopeptide repeat protein [Opitutaceae bacterium]
MAIALAAALAYANSLRAPFVLDDTQSVIRNPSIRHLADLKAVLTPDSGTTAGRPLVNLSFALNYAWSGQAVWSYHLVNVAWHALAAVTLFGLVRRTLARSTDRCRSAALPLAATTAAVWALHPLLTEVVTYVSERSELMMGACYLLTLYGLARAANADRPWRWLVLSVAAAWCGFASKEVMVTVPVIALLYDRAYLSESFGDALRRRRWYYGGLVLGWPLLAFLMTAYPIAGRGVGFGFGAGAATYALTEFRALATYLARAVWPAPLVFDYGPAAYVKPGQAIVLDGMIVAALVGAAITAWWKVKRIGFPALAFFILLAPTSSVVPIALQPIAESRMYLPLAALAVLAVVGVHAVGGRSGHRWIPGTLLLAALGLGVLSMTRNRLYADPIALWRDTVAKAPENPRACDSLGTTLAAAGQAAAARAEFEAALRIDPAFAPAHYNLGVILLNAGDPAGALPHLQQALAVANEQGPLNGYLGDALVQLGRYAEAIEPLRAAVRLQPGNVDAAFALGNALGAAGQYEAAANAFRQAAAWGPDRARVHNNLANALLYAGHVDEAVAEYRRAAALDPNDQSIRANLEQALRLPPTTHR